MWHPAHATRPVCPAAPSDAELPSLSVSRSGPEKDGSKKSVWPKAAAAGSSAKRFVTSARGPGSGSGDRACNALHAPAEKDGVRIGRIRSGSVGDPRIGARVEIRQRSAIVRGGAIQRAQKEGCRPPVYSHRAWSRSIRRAREAAVVPFRSVDAALEAQIVPVPLRFRALVLVHEDVGV